MPVGGPISPFLTRREVATALRLSLATVAEQIRDGLIPSVRWGRRRLIPVAWLAELAREPMEKARLARG